MLLVAFATAGMILRLEMGRAGEDPDRVWEILLAGVIGGLVGARGLHVVLNYSRVLEDPLEALLRGGLVWYGGLLLATTLIVLQARKTGVGLGSLFDAIAPAAAVGYAVGRVGCFLVGDDYGRPTDSWVGIAFPNGRPPSRVDVMESRFGISVDPEMIDKYGQVLPVHPTQLYEVGISAAIFFLLWSLRRHDHRKGWLFMVWLACAGAARFAVEFFRVKDDRIFGPLSASQVLSLASLTAGVIWAHRLYEHRIRSRRRATP